MACSSAEHRGCLSGSVRTAASKSFCDWPVLRSTVSSRSGTVLPSKGHCVLSSERDGLQQVPRSKYSQSGHQVVCCQSVATDGNSCSFLHTFMVHHVSFKSIRHFPL